MIDHLTLAVRNVEKSRAFYEAALKPLGYVVTRSFEGWVAFGTKKGSKIETFLWLKKGKPTKFHLSFRAPSEKAVHAFHDAAMAKGGKDNGGPGPRDHYGPAYYGAFVLDPD